MELQQHRTKLTLEYSQNSDDPDKIRLNPFKRDEKQASIQELIENKI